MIEHAHQAASEVLKLAPSGSTIHSELELDSSSFTKPGQFGTSDAITVEYFGTLFVWDFKYGIKIVDPKENTQAIYYGLAALDKFGKDFERVVIGILQPRAVHRDGSVRTWETTPEELDKWRPKYRNGVKKCEAPKPKYKRGDWCFFCRGKKDCPEFNEKIIERDKKDFSGDRVWINPEYVSSTGLKLFKVWGKNVIDKDGNLCDPETLRFIVKPKPDSPTDKWIEAHSMFSDEDDEAWLYGKSTKGEK